MSNVVARVKQLVELAVRSPEVEEARNAALQACKLIAHHGLTIGEAVAEEVLKEVAASARSSDPTRPEGRNPKPDLEAFGRTVARGVGRGVGKGVEKAIGDLFRGKKR